MEHKGWAWLVKSKVGGRWVGLGHNDMIMLLEDLQNLGQYYFRI